MQTKLSLTQKGNISAKVVNKEEHVCALCQQKHHMESLKMLLVDTDWVGCEMRFFKRRLKMDSRKFVIDMCKNSLSIRTGTITGRLTNVGDDSY